MIIGNYRVLKKIGNGGSCVVYLAKHDRLGQQRVIKCISKDNVHCKTFLKEVNFLKKYTHSSIPVLYDFEEDEKNYYIIQEYIEGNSLKKQILFQRNSSLNDILERFIQLTDFLKYLHEMKPYPVLYLDLKPEHVIFTDIGLKIVDFGAAVELKDSYVTGKCMGTYGFCAPEVIEGKKVDERADIYSTGALLYWCLTGETADESVSERICCKLMNYPEKLQEIIKCCLEYSPDNRYNSMEKLCDELTLLVNEGKVEKASYRIAVIGSQSHIGVTHFCVELVNYLNQNNNKCLYEQKNDSAFLDMLCNNSNDFYEEMGIIHGDDFAALPKYGEAVVVDNLNYNIIVCDYGSLAECVISDIRKNDLCIAIGGTKPWEIEYTKQLFAQMAEISDRIKVLHVLPHNVNCIKKKIYIFPYNPNPFKLDRKTREFFANMSSFIYSKRGRGVFLYEKFKKIKKRNGCSRHNRM